MKIYFFLGQEFTNHTDFNILSSTFKNTIKKNLPTSLIDEVLFFPATQLIDHIKVESDDIIIAASAGGNAVNKLVKKLIAKDPSFTPNIIGFEPYGLSEIPGVHTIVQHNDPNQIAEKNPNHILYKYTNSTKISGKNLHGHAFYTIRPEAVPHLEFLSDKCESLKDEEGNINYVFIPEANITIDSIPHNYHFLVAKINEINQSNEVILAAEKARIINYEFILGVAEYFAIHKTLEGLNIDNGRIQFERINERLQTKKTNVDLTTTDQGLKVLLTKYRTFLQTEKSTILVQNKISIINDILTIITNQNSNEVLEKIHNYLTTAQNGEIPINTLSQHRSNKAAQFFMKLINFFKGKGFELGLTKGQELLNQYGLFKEPVNTSKLMPNSIEDDLRSRKEWPKNSDKIQYHVECDGLKEYILTTKTNFNNADKDYPWFLQIIFRNRYQDLSGVLQALEYVKLEDSDYPALNLTIEDCKGRNFLDYLKQKKDKTDRDEMIKIIQKQFSESLTPQMQNELENLLLLPNTPAPGSS